MAPSAIAPDGNVSVLRPPKAYVTPRALETHEIPGIVIAFKRGAENYKQAAINAKQAGFDGVEIHGANGYLIDQVRHDGSNKRKDQDGGSLENRVRLALEITDAVIAVWGADRVGFHIAPRGDSHSMKDSNPEKLFTYLAEQLSKRKIAFIFAREYQGPDSLGPKIRKAFNGVYIANEAFSEESAEAIIENGYADAVSFGVQFIANPDLPRRFAEKLPLNEPNSSTFYAEGSTGYTDYPFLS